ncbi:hypothetical protein DDK07_07845 [Mycobacteroides abscessus]|uniref:DUF7572 family protein n=1 Tax=Mycobacteroides abscessus TaxID=36809 RepID=UPI000C25FA99|nr:hypothetical protein [Mycobacteroides abscessus]MDO3023413.1 hypothetical protein [Mycobacteroides abscessus subsp. abscessus]PVB51174.1 hypothetical protein DDK07_07845 [Mycobacteroides abscessus]RIR80169.1 hypothetical protein D2E68_04020 [Mycobacteroides abscessus]RIT29987.1 hypothetical protein D2E73_00585 [Mycobacteroides abscessus]RIT38015.1 hypothetical protein D2E99_00585 [Mycobacteroides abscessus]
MTKAVELQTDLCAWPQGCKHYRLSDGSYVVIDIDTPEERHDRHVDEITRGAAYVYTARPTVVIAVDENACATSLDRLHEFPPGTTHTEALEQIEEQCQ